MSAKSCSARLSSCSFCSSVNSGSFRRRGCSGICILSCAGEVGKIGNCSLGREGRLCMNGRRDLPDTSYKDTLYIEIFSQFRFLHKQKSFTRTHFKLPTNKNIMLPAEGGFVFL